MEKEDFLETCIALGGLDKESILKTILAEKFKSAQKSRLCEKVEPNPRGKDLLVHTPSQETFAEYAYDLCCLKDSKEDIIRHLLSIQFDAAVNAALKPRVRTRQSKQKVASSPVWKKKRLSSDISSGSDNESGIESQSQEIESVTKAAHLLCNISDDNFLPKKLHLFYIEENGAKRVANTISEILPKYFPGINTVWPGIYRLDNVFVLLVIDNGRYKNSWKSAGVQNKLTWFTSHEDVDRNVMDKILEPTSVVHVIRKRNGEMRYMGKCLQTEDVDRTTGSCVMYVA